MITKPSQITAELRRFGDPIYPSFDSWPLSVSDAANKWSNLLDNATAAIFPVVLPLIRITAKRNLAAQLELTFAAGAGIHGLPAAFQVYAATLATGMQPLFRGIPPPVPLNLLPILALQPTTPTAVATMSVMGLLISNWLRTGIAVNNSNGVLINWL